MKIGSERSGALGLGLKEKIGYLGFMETATVIDEGDRQTVRLPKGCRLPTPTVQVRREGEAVVLEPIRPDTWPEGFFDEIHIADPAFERPDQGLLPPIKSL
jgi:virulence-associated protein VagC